MVALDKAMRGKEDKGQYKRSPFTIIFEGKELMENQWGGESCPQIDGQWRCSFFPNGGNIALDIFI